MGHALTVEPDDRLAGVDAAMVLDQAPEGVAVIDGERRFVFVNPAAARLCGVERAQLLGSESPFPAPDGRGDPPPGHGEPVDTGEQLAVWFPHPGTYREFAYRLRPLADSGDAVVLFRDVTVARRHQRRLSAIASVASQVADQRSLRSTLDALAGEVFEADTLAAVQVLTVDPTGERFQVLGTAGFDSPPNFFDLLLECRDAGAELAIMKAFTTRRPVVMPHRYDVIMTDPAWAPLREHLRYPEWDWFASVPLIAGGKAVGVLNAYFEPGREVGQNTVDFLLAMAAQAAQAADYAALVERERAVAIQQERQRLARDLHDSAVQQVFSMGMQVETLSTLAGREGGVEHSFVHQVARELAQTTQVVLKDLRAMVTDLHPAPATDDGLPAAIGSLVESTRSRCELDIQVAVEDPERELRGLKGERCEDAYRVIAEALYNSIKHSEGSQVRIALTARRRGGRRWLRATVTDDGRGLAHTELTPESSEGGFGMTAMRERARRWGGNLTARSAPGEGTVVRLVLPLPENVPTGAVPVREQGGTE
ncbi:sensor histidine kinase [Phytoactinopolyspora halotolerans]|uniref:Oxygen sensor histidine kinase NreB n=1 Tax=Phytoactinopolyspora halotolerans TaxID=1981512 RepID=A0A6L9S8Z4_9ACTN|nr:ATP-binding protein [Phytoactinopolyspora halotolerans]NEE00440.1 GAF domain-containing protein [Phytoactinopolyspora halotolerans]